MNRNMIRHGFILFLLALVAGLFVQTLKIPRLGLSAHTIGLVSGILLIAIGGVWEQFSLSRRQSRVMYWSWLYSSYVNWFGVQVGAIFGAGKVTPIASSGAVGSGPAEIVMMILLGSVGLVSFLAVGLSLWGLRSNQAVDET